MRRASWRLVGAVVFGAMLSGIASCGGGSGSDGTAMRSPVGKIVLNGRWELTEGALDDRVPAVFAHTIPVPGFVDLATPPLADVGVPSELRQAFWYRRTFSVPADAGPVATLRLHKAKYGAAVWLNGTRIGTHAGAFTLFEADVSDAVVRGATNTLVVRVGADKRQVPATVPTGEDIEKYLWLPGIWDDVSIAFSGPQRIVRVKIEPLIESDGATVRTTLLNRSTAPVDVDVRQVVRDQFGTVVADVTERRRLPAGQSTATQFVTIPEARWWSPEDPFLYHVTSRVTESAAVTDELETRFGMRSVEWRSGDEPGFFLNGERYYLRGSNLSLHRFFQSAERGQLPWDPDWVRRLLSTHPKALHWNSMRVSIGRLPNLWYDLADEIGIILADEFMMWSLARESAQWSIEEMEAEYRRWIEENWNHPSIGWWDASNETDDPKSTEVIARVRDLDPTRQWENGGHSPPQGPSDPVEEHAYVLFALRDLADLPLFVGPAPVVPATAKAPGHPYILNEYNLLWLQRDGLPVPSAVVPYQIVPRMDEGPYSAAEYREAYAYVGAVLTEFWRASRMYAGVQHFTYITESKATGDNFLDVVDLILEPRWQRYAADAFAPLAVHLDFWEAPAGPARLEVPMVLINDQPEAQRATLELIAVNPAGDVVARSAPATVEIAGLGDLDIALSLEVPALERWVLFARLEPNDPSLPTTWSRRKLGYTHLGEPIPDPPFGAALE